MTGSCVKSCHVRLSHSKHLAQKYLPSDVSIISVHWRKDIHSGCSENLQKDWQNASAATKKKDDAVKCQHTRLTFSHWQRHSRTASGWQYTSLILVSHEVKVNEAYYRNVMLSQQFLLAVHQVSSRFFIFQQDSAPVHTPLSQSAFFAVTLPDIEQF